MKPGDKVWIAGIEATIGTPEECETADVVVCMRKGSFSQFTDNLEAPCSRCGETVIFRPYMPVTPAKVCTVCMFEEMEATLQ